MNNDAHDLTPPPPCAGPDSASRPAPAPEVIVIGRPQRGGPDFAAHRPPRLPTRTRRALILFLLTCLSTFLVGFYGQPVVPHWYFIEVLFETDVETLLAQLVHGMFYSAGVMAILSAHEMGHYLQARRYGVPASLPFFIPLPISPFGTMGAVIVQQSGVASRKSMFDIAISGPLAGLVLTLPMVYWGLRMSVIRLAPTGHAGLMFGQPLLLEWMSRLVLGPIPAGKDLFMHPMLFAGWVGIFITALNLIPIGQLDGGHILYCLIGRKAHFVARGLFLLGVCTVAYSYFFGDNSFISWTLMLFLIWMFGTRHPPTANDAEQLGITRIVLGWLTLMFVVIGLTPTPIAEFKPKTQPAVERSAGETADQ